MPRGEKTKQLWQNLAYRENMSSKHKGRPTWNKGLKLPEQSEQTKKKRSNSLKNHIVTPETRAKISNSHKGIRPTEFSKQKNRIAHTNPPEDVRKKIREARSKQIIPRKDSSIELKTQKQLDTNGIEYIKHEKIQGQPDIFIPAKETDTHKGTAIFLDGCYWHACHECKIIPNTNKSQHLRASEQWYKDFYNKYQLELEGYKVIRIWEHDINKPDFDISFYINRVL